MEKAATLTEQEIVEIKDAHCLSHFALESLIKKNCITVGTVTLGEYKIKEELCEIEIKIYGLLRNRDDKQQQGQEIDTFFIHNDHDGSLDVIQSIADLPLFIKKHQIEADNFITRMEKANVTNS